MTYNGRAVLEEIATQKCWEIKVFPSYTSSEMVTYERGVEWITILWSLENTAKFIGYGTTLDDNITELNGPLGLIKAREIIEKPSRS